MMEKTILIVEDDQTSAKMISDILSVKGYHTIVATDGVQGVEFTRIFKPDLVLMDIMMPGMDGYAACFEIKSNQSTSDIPVVMVTALTYELNKTLAKKLLADGYLTKPFTPRQLLQLVDDYLKAS